MLIRYIAVLFEKKYQRFRQMETLKNGHSNTSHVDVLLDLLFLREIDSFDSNGYLSNP